MKKLPVTLDLDALRSFVTGIECGSFAQVQGDGYIFKW
jgi:hypothetical protein